MRHSKADCALCQRAIVHHPVIFKESGVVRIGCQIARAHVVMLAFDHPAQAREIGLRLVRADVTEGIRFAVIDTVRREDRMQRVPVRRFVGVNRRIARNDLQNVGNAFVLVARDERARAALALADRDNHAAVR